MQRQKRCNAELFQSHVGHIWLEVYGLRPYPVSRRACSKVSFLFHTLVTTLTNNLLIFRVAQPLFLGKLIRYFTNPASMSKDDAYLHAGGVILCSGLAIVTLHPYMLGIMHIGMQMRVAACSLIYRKVNLIAIRNK